MQRNPRSKSDLASSKPQAAYPAILPVLRHASSSRSIAVKRVIVKLLLWMNSNR